MILVPPQHSHLSGITASTLLLHTLAPFPHVCGDGYSLVGAGREEEGRMWLAFSPDYGSTEQTFQFCSVFRQKEGTEIPWCQDAKES